MWRDGLELSPWETCGKWPCGAALGEAPGLEPLELLGDGVFDDGGEVAVGDLGAHEGREPLELVAQLGAGGELDLVAAGRERLDDCAAETAGS